MRVPIAHLISSYSLIFIECVFYTIYPADFIYVCSFNRGQGNSTVVRVSIYQAGDLHSHLPRSACVSKVELYHCAIDLSQPVPTAGSKKAVYVILCLCNYACKRSLAICHKSRALCPISSLLSVPI